MHERILSVAYTPQGEIKADDDDDDNDDDQQPTAHVPNVACT